ncbi:hypothetical protein Pmani_013408 [Petrolisthes manimaculis]|uniref:Uncharacterized protein n=1 Tax=Petrolisthes manimaculis TaxID=1843537 RepID=A0AAE1PVZ4_9EUCA|nr:hypothetical protein Pmani_013408 [Petrolisthes manimaculis]
MLHIGRVWCLLRRGNGVSVTTCKNSRQGGGSSGVEIVSSRVKWSSKSVKLSVVLWQVCKVNGGVASV